MISRRGLIAVMFFVVAGCGFAWAQALGPDQIEAKVRADLEALVSKVIEPHEFSLQVSATVERVNERQLVEGEQIVQPGARRPVEVPPLPGFDPPVVRPSAPEAGQLRQVFRNVERPVLKALAVNLLIDQGLDGARAKGIEELVRAYLNSGYPGTARLTTQRLAMRKPSAPSWWGGLMQEDVFRWLTVVGLFAIGGLAWMLWRLGRRLNSLSRHFDPPYRSVSSLDTYETEVTSNDRVTRPEISPAVGESALLPAARLASSTRVAGGAQHGNDRGRAAFSGVPANPQYADLRRQLLDTFLQSASVFRLYFEKLDDVARAELCSALSGPAFDTLIDSLKLVPVDPTTVTPPSEDQLQFYLKNFSEFHEALRWQERQFFGFLPHLTDEQLVALVQSQSPVVGALILKFSRAEVSARILENLKDNTRSQIIDQFERTREMSPQDLKNIEETLRDAVRSLPNFILGSARQELEYWSKLLALTPDPQKVLGSLERVRPDLYEKLAKYRFQLEDIPSLPTPLVRKVMDEFENDELARALSRQASSLVQYALGELPEARRRLLSNQIVSYQNADMTDVKKSEDKLTRKFREVLA